MTAAAQLAAVVARIASELKTRLVPSTTEVKGLVELATPAETTTGTDTTRAVTPAGLKTETGSTDYAALVAAGVNLTATGDATLPFPAGVPSTVDLGGTQTLRTAKTDRLFTFGDSMLTQVGDSGEYGTGLAAYGGSTVRGLPKKLATMLGYSIADAGNQLNWTVSVGGRTSTELAMIVGTVNPLFTFASNSLPATAVDASTGVTVTPVKPVRSWRRNSSSAGPWVFAGKFTTLDGSQQIPGSLRKDTSVDGVSGWTFWPTTPAGSAVAIPAAGLWWVMDRVAGLPSGSTLSFGEWLDGIVVTRMGTNNYYEGDSWPGRGTFDDAIRDTLAFRNLLLQRTRHPRHLVLSILTPSASVVGQSQHDRVVQTNAKLANLFGDSFVDTRRYLIDQGLTVNGLTPTTADMVAICGDTVPPQLLSSDAQHPNGYGYYAEAVAVYQKLIAKGWA